jgi:uncharacterized protein (TIGR03435 family)
MELVQLAHGELQGRLIGGDRWMRSERYDIIARARTQATVREMATAMLREILAQRFALRTHRETRDTRVYALSVADGGADRLKAGVAADCVESQETVPVRLLENGRAAPAPGRTLPCGFILLGTTLTGATVLQAVGARIDAIARSLERQLDRPIVDRTGLPGRLNADFEYTPPGSTPLVNISAPSLFVAIRENLGLQLRPASGQADFLVIDSAARPSND